MIWLASSLGPTRSTILSPLHNPSAIIHASIMKSPPNLHQVSFLKTPSSFRGNGLVGAQELWGRQRLSVRSMVQATRVNFLRCSKFKLVRARVLTFIFAFISR